MPGLRSRIGPSLAAGWPFLFFWKYVVPISGKYAAIGNDFEHLYYRYKLVVIEGLSRGRMPLWSPSEAAGFVLYANPFAAAFYPLNVVLAAIYRFAGGYERLDHQVYTVVGVSIFSLGIYRWLTAMGIPVRAALFSACAMSSSFRICDMMRFPNAVHTAAWYPWILLALYRTCTAGDDGTLKRGAVLLVAASIGLSTGGYLYYVYYAQFLLVPYFVALTVPWVRRSLFPAVREGRIGSRPWTTVGLAGLIAAIVCLPYLMAVTRLMNATQDRDGRDFAYSTEHVFGTRDTLGSWIYPPSSASEGWYYFGLVGSLLIAVFVARVVVRARSERSCHGVRFVGLLLAWLAVVTYITYGRDSLLFAWLWRHWPLFSRLRVWGRMNIILLLPLAWLVAAAYSWFDDWLQRSKPIVEGSSWAVPIGICTGYLVALGAQLRLLRRKDFSVEWVTRFRDLWRLEPAFVYSGLFGFTVLMVAVLLSFRKGLSGKQSSIVTAALLAATAVDLYPAGSALWALTGKVTPRVAADIQGQYRESFGVCRKDDQGTMSLSPAFNTGIVANWDYRRYVDFRRGSEAQGEAVLELLGIKGCQKIFQTGANRYAWIRDFLEDARAFEGRWTLVEYDGDRLRVRAEMPRAGFLSFIDNWDPDWHARVDGEDRPVELLYGTFKSVAVPAGEHEVEFVYRPRLFRMDP